MLRRGIWIGLKTSIPLGGQIIPISMAGANLLWKNLQKNLTKNKISEVINRIIPHRIPKDTIKVWWPWNVASREISRHHWYIINIRETNLIKNRFVLKKWNHLIIPVINIKALSDPKIGQGLISTKWKGWFLCDDIIYFSRIKSC